MSSAKNRCMARHDRKSAVMPDARASADDAAYSSTQARLNPRDISRRGTEA